MIRARKSRLFNAWFAGHARRRIERTFGRVLVRGLAEAVAHARAAPILVVANHSTWWDALVTLFVSEHLLRTDGYALMNATNLERLPFFGRVGAFGVDLADPVDGAHAIRHAAKLLDRPGRLVWVYPQGREVSPFAELELLPGAAQIARVAKRAVVIPVGIRYVFGAAEQPDLWLSFGAPLDPLAGLAGQKGGIARELAAIDAGEGFEIHHARRPSVVGGLAERLLSFFTR